MNKIFITVFGDLTEAQAQALYRCAKVASEGRISQSVNDKRNSKSAGKKTANAQKQTRFSPCELANKLS